jgi:hypothetical protein
MSEVMENNVNSEVMESNVVNLESISDHYSHLKLLVESIESDVIKSNKGNKAAGVRLRKSLRHLKGFSGDFVKFTLSKD